MPWPRFELGTYWIEVWSSGTTSACLMILSAWYWIFIRLPVCCCWWLKDKCCCLRCTVSNKRCDRPAGCGTSVTDCSTFLVPGIAHSCRIWRKMDEWLEVMCVLMLNLHQLCIMLVQILLNALLQWLCGRRSTSSCVFLL
jgi:hypothetical protein